MSVQAKIHALGSIRQLSPCGARVRRRARIQEIAALTLVIAFGALGNLQSDLISPVATGVDLDGSASAPAALPPRN